MTYNVRCSCPFPPHPELCIYFRFARGGYRQLHNSEYTASMFDASGGNLVVERFWWWKAVQGGA